jgi:hypothetical protein
MDRFYLPNNEWFPLMQCFDFDVDPHTHDYPQNVLINLQWNSIHLNSTVAQPSAATSSDATWQFDYVFAYQANAALPE